MQEVILGEDVNPNDFRKCKVGDRLWSIQAGDCEIRLIDMYSVYPITCIDGDGVYRVYTLDGKRNQRDKHQSLFFFNPFPVISDKSEADKIKELEEKLKEAEVLLTEFQGISGDEDCRPDHHGYCQAHYLHKIDKCPVKLTKQFLDSSKKGANNGKG